MVWWWLALAMQQRWETLIKGQQLANVVQLMRLVVADADQDANATNAKNLDTCSS